MPRRNRKGRRPGQRPRKQAARYHSARESRREWRELVALDEQPKPSPPRQCGNCLEWLPPRADALGGRGMCTHPGSGILAPEAETAGCHYFNARR